MPPRVIKHQLTCPLEITYGHFPIGRRRILVIPRNHLGVELDSCVCVIKIHFSSDSQRNKKFELFCEGTYDFQIFRNEPLFVADYEYAFGWLTAKLLLKESTILWKVCTFGWMNLSENHWWFVCKPSCSFSHNFTTDKWKVDISQNLKIVGLLGKKFVFFIPLGIQTGVDFHHTKTIIKLHSFIPLKRYLNDNRRLR